MTDLDLVSVLEALLHICSEPVSTERLAHAAGVPSASVADGLARLALRHAEGCSGLVLERVGGGYAFRVAEGAREACGRLIDRSPDRPLSPAAMETLAVIAYSGPVSRPEIARIRGVSADAAVAGLLDRGLIEEAGRADTPGGAVTYCTTTIFDRVFGLPEGRASLPVLDDLTPDEAAADALRERLAGVASLRDDTS